MSQEDVNRTGIAPRVEEMRGKRMPQRMNARAAVNVRPPSCLFIDFAGGITRHRLGEEAAREQPPWGPDQLPVGPQFSEQARREQRITVFIALALGHADQHAITLNVRDWQADHLTDAQAPGIRGHQQGAVLRMCGGGKEALEFLDAEDLWEALAVGARGEI